MQKLALSELKPTFT